MKVGDMVVLRVPYKDDNRIGIVRAKAMRGGCVVYWLNVPHLRESIWPYSGLIQRRPREKR